jgi:uncharacterized protein YbbK (DUF523 family)/uncharacterized protein YbgA (DUF1722 family)
VGVAMTEHPIRLGISRCLLGEPVRYDGGHKRDRFLTDVLGRYVEWVPVCPEVEAGFGTPREAMRLEGERGKLRIMTIESRRNMTKPLTLFTEQKLDALVDAGLSGYIFKKDSPSCGIKGVRVFDRRGVPSRIGAGLFARAFAERFPLIPIEDEGRLRAPEIRDHFIERVFCYHRWRALANDEPTRQAIVHFHTTHKYLLMAHGAASCRVLDRLVAQAHRYRPEDLAKRYGTLFMGALAVKATRRKQVNVLQHLVGQLKGRLAIRIPKNVRSAIPREPGE